MSGLAQTCSKLPVRPLLLSLLRSIPCPAPFCSLQQHTISGNLHHSLSAQAETQSSGASNAGSHSSHWQPLLLDKALGHVKTHGWSRQALQAAAHDLGLSPAVAGLLPRREAQLVEHFIRQCNRELTSQLTPGSPSSQVPAEWSTMSSKQRLSHAVRMRLSMLIPYIETWPQALSVVSQPHTVQHSLPLLGELVDEMWAQAGDVSSDTSWYMKRALLAKVYVATELYLLTDYSPGYEETWQALERRLDDALAFGDAAQEMQQAVKRTMARPTHPKP